MLYCTYAQYQAAGGALDEAAFGPLCLRASKLLDRHTFGRAEPHAKLCADCAALLSDACVQIIEAMNAAQSALRSALGSPAYPTMATRSPLPRELFPSG